MKIHFIGIGGISMSGLAHVALHLGYAVSGSDENIENPSVRHLSDKGAVIFSGHRPENISSETNLVVYTAAVREDNPEILRARELKIPALDRAQFLSNLMDKYSRSIAVAGTHGKTSTTSMISVIFQHAQKDPTILIGGELAAIGGNFRVGHSDFFITEACEYVDSFLKFYPQTAVILNIEREHMDYFRDMEHILSSYGTFASQVREDGIVIANGDDTQVRAAMRDVKRSKIFFGFDPQNDAQIRDKGTDEEGNIFFDLFYEGRLLGHFALPIPGIHNVYNAAASVLAAHLNGVCIEDVRSALASYTGVGRRFELKGLYNGARVYDDYAHHPSELRATLEAAESLKRKRLYTVFQPHTFTRTKEFLSVFAESFAGSDVVIISDIYPSRERDTGLIHARDLVDAIRKTGKEALYIGDKEEIRSYLADELRSEDVLLLIGAGDIYKVSEKLLSEQQK
ncbi:MAG: UDP-N-acetylmuramate--L-alanine ligase [Peptostreptococcaceae bacterium]|nr:UDP-N-acetylmuramate--L-alanine ligase [Peptostreptococcaceae bacterium]